MQEIFEKTNINNSKVLTNFQKALVAFRVVRLTFREFFFFLSYAPQKTSACRLRHHNRLRFLRDQDDAHFS